MRKKLVSLAVLLALPLLILAQENKLIKYIPSNASLVMVFNPMQVVNKVPGETFRQSALYRSMMKDDAGGVTAFLSDPSITGIDFGSDVLLLSISSDKGDMITFVGSLKDDQAFSKIIEKMPDAVDNIRDEEDARIYIAGEGNLGIAWNKEAFVAVGPNKAEMKKELIAAFSDTTRSADFDYDKWMKEYVEKYTEQLNQTCTMLIHPEKKETKFSNPAFDLMMKESGDIRFWTNGEGFPGALKDVPPGFAGIFSKLKKMTGGNKISIINFENGKIISINRNFLSPEIAEVYRKFPPKQLNGTLLKRLPDQRIVCIFTNTVQTEMGSMLLEKSGLSTIFDSLKAKAPFDLELLKSTFGGEMLFAILEKDKVKEKDDKDEEYAPSKIFERFELIGAIGIVDHYRFEKLKASIDHTLDSLKKTDSFKRSFKNFNPVVRYNDSLLVISSSEETAEKFLKNSDNRQIPEWISVNQAHPMLLELDLNELFGTMFSSASLAPDKNEEDLKIFEMFDKLIVSGGDYTDGSLNSRTEFTFTKKDENSFKQLFDLLNYGVEQAEKRKIELKDEEVEIPPPPPPPPPKVEMKKVTPSKTKTKTKN